MNNIDNIISMQLNPTQAMARSGLIGCAVNGDEDAVKMLKALKTDAPSASPPLNTDNDVFRKVASAYSTAAWVRHYVTDMLFKALRMSTFVDLGCGVNHRGVSFSKMKDIRYYGIDLPRIIDEARQATLSLIMGVHLDNRIRLSAVDITDYDSLRFAVNAREPVFIATEGLMMYLTEKEMLTAAENINRLLSEFGGVWVTNDMYAKELNDSIIDMLFPVSGNDARSAVKTMLSGKTKGLIFENSFTSLKGPEHEHFMQELGFNCREMKVWQYLERLDIPAEIRPAFKDMMFRIFTSDICDSRYKEAVRKSSFTVDSVNEAGNITLTVSGRIDTITAPKLIEAFELRMKDPVAKSLSVDMSGCAYISSAGLRAMMMMYKHMKKTGGEFFIKNLRPEVYEIISVTGFSDFM